MKKEIYDDRINCHVGDLKKQIEKLAELDPGQPGVAVIVRRLLSYGLEHAEKCKKRVAA